MQHTHREEIMQPSVHAVRRLSLNRFALLASALGAIVITSLLGWMLIEVQFASAAITPSAVIYVDEARQVFELEMNELLYPTIARHYTPAVCHPLNGIVSSATRVSINQKADVQRVRFRLAAHRFRNTHCPCSASTTTLSPSRNAPLRISSASGSCTSH